MSTTPTCKNFSATCQVFVPSGFQQHQSNAFAPSNVQQKPQMYTSQVQYPQMGGFGDFSNQMLQVPAYQPHLNYSSNSLAHTERHVQAFGAPAQPRLTQANSMQQSTNFNFQQQAQMNGFRAAPMPEVKLNFQSGQHQAFNAQSRRANFVQQQSYDAQLDNKQYMRKQFASNKGVHSSISLTKADMPASLPLAEAQQAYIDSSSPITKSTNASSMGGSQYGSDEDLEMDMTGFDSPVNAQLGRKHSGQSYGGRVSTPTAVLNKNAKQENGWKKKVKTELCRFWLQGQECENSQKEQGCGFAHGQDELQKKKGLSRQYLTSVCKNFLDHPSKCTYGQRCIFQHPTYDVRKRQNYTKMMQDNARYTAMRLFQDIEGSEVIYINTYAATTPRLAAFRGICSSAKDNGEDYVDEEEEEQAEANTSFPTSNFSRDLFRSGCQ